MSEWSHSVSHVVVISLQLRLPTDHARIWTEVVFHVPLNPLPRAGPAARAGFGGVRKLHCGGRQYAYRDKKRQVRSAVVRECNALTINFNLGIRSEN